MIYLVLIGGVLLSVALFLFVYFRSSNRDHNNEEGTLAYKKPTKEDVVVQNKKPEPVEETSYTFETPNDLASETAVVFPEVTATPTKKKKITKAKKPKSE